MIKTFFYILLLIGLSVVAVTSFFRVIDAALEIDDLKSQVHLQQREFQFLQTLTNHSLSSCDTTIESFEAIAKSSGHVVLWQDQVALVGPFKVTKKDSCILNIEQVGLFYTPK